MNARSTSKSYDESDVKIRPSRRTRPRTKDRPEHADSILGRVIAVDRGRTTCLIGAHEKPVTAMKARELGQKSVVVGDLVDLVGDVSGTDGTLCRIVSVQ